MENKEQRRKQKYRRVLAARLPRALDRRVKLTDEDKENIRALRKDGLPIREIARMYEHKCTRRTIQYVLRPELYEKLRASFVARRKDGRYKPSKDEWAATMREHRAYKKKVIVLP